MPSSGLFYDIQRFDDSKLMARDENGFKKKRTEEYASINSPALQKYFRTVAKAVSTRQYPV